MTGLPINLGAARSDGSPVTFDLRKAPHMLIAGTTGSGKSVAIHGILCDLLRTQTPADLGLVLIDPKRVELSDYADLPHLAMPVQCDPLGAIEALGWVLEQVEARFTLMQEHGARDIAALPLSVLAAAGQPRALLMVVDELADLIMASKSLPGPMRERIKRGELGETEVTLARILQIGRAAGVHCILATQRPSSDIVTGVIKANVPTRLTFALQNATDSRVAMGRKGAEELAGKGDALWLPVGAREAVRLQGRWVTDEERQDAVARWKGLSGVGAAGSSAGQATQSGAAALGPWGKALGLAEMPLPEVPIGHGKNGEVSKRQARIHNKRVRRTEDWNQSGTLSRAVATGMAALVVAAFVLVWLVTYLRLAL